MRGSGWTPASCIRETEDDLTLAGVDPNDDRRADRRAKSFEVSGDEELRREEETRHESLDRLYSLLADLSDRVGEPRLLGACTSRSGWPSRGVYFFFEPGETREDCSTPRVVRVGTHALSTGSKSTLWKRLSAHRGQLSGRSAGGGNHRGSVFRRHVGAALIGSGHYRAEVAESWGKGSNAPRATRDREHVLEIDVSRQIGAMSVLWLEIDDSPGPKSDRGFIEANSIGLLSNRGRPPTDPPSTSWLGSSCDRSAIRDSGLWNVNHVDHLPDGRFLDRLARYVAGQSS